VALIERAFPRNQIVGTKYFTAKVSALPDNPGQPIRQMIFWRALRTLPNLEILVPIAGHREKTPDSSRLPAFIKTASLGRNCWQRNSPIQ